MTIQSLHSGMMSAPDYHTSPEVEFKSFRDCDQTGNCLSQTIVFHCNDSSWWIRVIANWPLPEQVLMLGRLKRQFLFHEFLAAMDFVQFSLLDNTVTAIALNFDEQAKNPIMIRKRPKTSANFFIGVSHRLCYTVAEDSLRVVYPDLDIVQDLVLDLSVRTVEARCLQKIEDINPPVCTVIYQGQKLAYKTIDRPLYEPEDTTHILNEIKALAQFSGCPNIAQIRGLVVSENPYKKSPSTSMPSVITGFLVEYYSGGSLEQVIGEGKLGDCSLPLQWAMQIGNALKSLHESGRTHLDIKPSNVVFDDMRRAILIDISGTGGFKWEWLSPEMQKALAENCELVLADAPFETRVGTDSWAYGRVLLSLAKLADSDTLRAIAHRLLKELPHERISLSDGLLRLETRSEQRSAVRLKDNKHSR